MELQLIRSLIGVLMLFYWSSTHLRTCSKSLCKLLILPRPMTRRPQVTEGFGDQEKAAVEMLEKLSDNGFKKMMQEYELDAMVTLGSCACPVLAIGGFPAITFPVGYGTDCMRFGICFRGLKSSEPKLIEIAYAFEHATRVRKLPPPFTEASI